MEIGGKEAEREKEGLEGWREQRCDVKSNLTMMCVHVGYTVLTTSMCVHLRPRAAKLGTILSPAFSWRMLA